jgi:hypothetical protein
MSQEIMTEVELPKRFRELVNWYKRPAGSYQKQGLNFIKPLLNSRLAFVKIEDEIGEPGNIFEDSFLCAEIKD